MTRASPWHSRLRDDEQQRPESDRGAKEKLRQRSAIIKVSQAKVKVSRAGVSQSVRPVEWAGRRGAH
eukprot:1185151-Prorocentrum_minimum.AAC.3